jgi:phosphohistidine phosphatase
MKLHLLRHAKTQPVAVTGKDFDRILLPKGRAQAEKLGEYWIEHPLGEVAVFCSSSARTTETAGLVSEVYPLGQITYIDGLYHASLKTLMDFITARKEKQDLLLIGHNEGISDLAAYLLDDFYALQTCGYICIEFEQDSWAEISKGLGRVAAAFRPEVGADH